MLKFLHLALGQLADADPNNEELAEYLIAFQLQSDAKGARKLTKALLKQRPSSLRLYNAYALVECRLENFEAAERAWSTAISMSGTFPNSDRQDAILLWHTWIWQLLDRAEPHKAFALLLATPDGQVDASRLSLSNSQDAHSTAILKARRNFESNLAQAASLHHSDLVVHYSGLLALLAYFTSTDPLTAALAAYARLVGRPATTSTSTPNQPSIEQLLHQARARLLVYHTRTRSPFRATDMASLLATSLSLFPTNTIFQSLYHNYTRHTLLADRIRSVIPTLHSALHSALAKGSIVPAVFDIWSEMTRPTYAGSTRHSVRAAFEHALDLVNPLHTVRWSGPGMSGGSLAPPGRSLLNRNERQLLAGEDCPAWLGRKMSCTAACERAPGPRRSICSPSRSRDYAMRLALVGFGGSTRRWRRRG